MATATTDTAKRRKVETMIRSCLISAKEGVGLRVFANDFVSLCGEEVPYREFGYPTLHAYLLSIPNVARLTGSGASGITVHGVADESSAHVAKLVSAQRAKKKNKGKGKSGGRFGLASRKSVSRVGPSKLSPKPNPSLGPSMNRASALANRPKQTPLGNVNANNINTNINNNSNNINNSVGGNQPIRAHPGWQKSAATQKRKNLPQSDLRHRIPKPNITTTPNAAANSSSAAVQRQETNGISVASLSSQYRQLDGGGGGDGPASRKPNEVSDTILKERCRSIVGKYANGVWFDKFLKDYVKLHGNSDATFPADMKGRLKQLDDLIEVDTRQANWIVKIRRESTVASGSNEATTIMSAGGDVGASSMTSSTASAVGVDNGNSASGPIWVKVNIAHIEDPHNIFVHLDLLKVKFIQREVNTLGGAGQSSSSLTEIAYDRGETVGMAIWDEVQGGDGCWYRVQVQQVRQDLASIRFIDYGNVGWKPLNNVYRLTVKILEFPAQALHCRMFGVDAPLGGWKPEHVEILNQTMDQLTPSSDQLFVQMIRTDDSSPFGGPLCEVDIRVPLNNVMPSKTSIVDVFKTKLLSMGPLVASVAPANPLPIATNLAPPLPPPPPVSSAPPPSVSLARALPLLLPPADVWESVFVSDVQSPTDLTIRLTGPMYSEKLTALETKMNRFYSEECSDRDCALHQVDVQVGMIVAAISEEGDLDEEGNQNWFRARIDRLIDMQVKPSVECTLVDHGGRFCVDVVNLRRLLPEFEIFAHQGVRCALKDFSVNGDSYSESFYDCLLDSLVGIICRAIVHARFVGVDNRQLATTFSDAEMAALASSSTTTTNLLPQREDAPPFVVVSLISEDGVDLNADLLAVEREMRAEAEEEANADSKDERFGDGEAKEEGDISDDEEEEEDEEEDKMRRPKLPSVGSRGQYFVSFVAANGDVFLQSPSLALDQVIELMDTLAPSLDATNATEAPPKVGDLCCAKFDEDQKWYRAVVVEDDSKSTPTPSSDHRTVFFVDFGNTSSVPVSAIRRVADNDIDNPLTLLPFQSIRARLSELPASSSSSSSVNLGWRPKAADRLWELCCEGGAGDNDDEDGAVIVQTVFNPHQDEDDEDEEADDEEEDDDDSATVITSSASSSVVVLPPSAPASLSSASFVDTSGTASFEVTTSGSNRSSTDDISSSLPLVRLFKIIDGAEVCINEILAKERSLFAPGDVVGGITPPIMPQLPPSQPQQQQQQQQQGLNLPPTLQLQTQPPPIFHPQIPPPRSSPLQPDVLSPQLPLSATSPSRPDALLFIQQPPPPMNNSPFRPDVLQKALIQQIVSQPPPNISPLASPSLVAPSPPRPITKRSSADVNTLEEMTTTSRAIDDFHKLSLNDVSVPSSMVLSDALALTAFMKMPAMMPDSMKMTAPDSPNRPTSHTLPIEEKPESSSASLSLPVFAPSLDVAAPVFVPRAFGASTTPRESPQRPPQKQQQQPQQQQLQHQASPSAMLNSSSSTPSSSISLGRSASTPPPPKLQDFPSDYDSWPSPPAPSVLTAGDEMSVMVLSTWNGPSRFIVSDVRSRNAYIDMENEMNAFYSDPRNAVTPPASPLKADSLYVGYFTAYRSWYRFLVKSDDPVDNAGGVIAKLVDYGEVAAVPRHFIQPLLPKFRTLPYQAYASSLNGIEPADGGTCWSDEAKIYLDNLILEKYLFAMINSVSVDERYFPAINLTLELVETSEEKDVVITHAMVAKGMARRKP